MAHIYEPRVRETSLSETTDDFVLEGAMRGSLAFGDVMAEGDTCDYVAAYDSTFEEGLGLMNGDGELERAVVYRSLHANGTVDQNKVSFGANPKTIIMTIGGRRVAALNAAAQCYLSLSGSNLILSRGYGSPLAPAELAPTGTTGGTAYYIYESVTGVLSFSATGYVFNVHGMPVQDGDPTKLMVGLWYASADNTWSPIETQGASWFNPQTKFAHSAAVSRTVTNTSPAAEVHSSDRLRFVTFANRPVAINFGTTAANSTADQDNVFNVGLDGVSTLLAPHVITYRHEPSGQTYARYLSFRNIKRDISEGLHYITAAHFVSGGSLTVFGHVSAEIEG